MVVVVIVVVVVVVVVVVECALYAVGFVAENHRGCIS